MPGDMVKVDRGDGHIFKMTRKAAETFIRQRPGAHIRGAGAAQPSPAAAAPAADSALGTMTREELNAYAATLGVQDAEGARTKADVIALITEAQKAQ